MASCAARPRRSLGRKTRNLQARLCGCCSQGQLWSGQVTAAEGVEALRASARLHDVRGLACSAVCVFPPHNMRTCSAQPAIGWLVGRLSALASRATPPSPRPHAANEENAALRKAIEDANYECSVGLLRLNQLDLVTVVASPATVRRSATVPSPGATHLAIWTSSMRSPLLYRSRRGATVPSALSVDNDSARPWTTTRWR